MIIIMSANIIIRGLENRVGRILQNMLPDDVEAVLDEGIIPRPISK